MCVRPLMRGWERLKNINLVSGKSGETHSCRSRTAAWGRKRTSARGVVSAPQAHPRTLGSCSADAVSVSLSAGGMGDHFRLRLGQLREIFFSVREPIERWLNLPRVVIE